MTVKENMYLTFCKHFPTIPKYLVFDMQILITEETLDDYLMKPCCMLRKSWPFSIPRIGYISAITRYILSASRGF